MNKIIVLLFLFCSFSFAQLEMISSQSNNKSANFGWDVDIHGNWAVISAPNENTDDQIYSGKVYLHKLENGHWVNHSFVTPEFPDALHYFGQSISIWDNYFIAGAVGHFQNGPFSGAAYIFKLENDQWIQESLLNPSDGEAVNYFGQSVDIFKDIAVVGAHYGKGNVNKSGKVYIFRNIGNEWVEETKLSADDGRENDLFGFSVALQNDETIVVGAPKADGNIENSGAVYVFKYSDNKWNQVKKLYAPDGQVDEQFGYSVDIDHNKIVTGAYIKQGNAFNAGAVYIYKNDNDSWLLEESISDPENELNSFFGIRVDMHGDFLVVGAPKDSSPIQNKVGSISLYKFENDEWNFLKKYYPEDGNKNDYFGLSIAMDSTNMLIGSRLHDFNNIDDGATYSIKYNNVTSVEDELPLSFELYQNYPNPFNPTTKIKYDLPSSGNVSLKIYNILGREIKTLINSFEEAGRKEVVWNGKNNFQKDVAAGIYFYRITAGDYINVKKMIFLK